MSAAHDERARLFGEVADMIVDIAREVRLRGAVDAPGVPLNQTHSQVMRFVHAHPGEAGSAIARAIGIKRSNVSAALQELRDLGYVTLERSTTDARAMQVFPTALAEQTVASLRGRWGDLLGQAWERAPGDLDDLVRARETLTALMAGLRGIRDE
ncbi:hypothetical protein GCM10009808_23000 [Microbacterium sediminicola]|uniref:HTH marR-type domain-containing protein n=1 Tax=Microbacterium sediminicola TaxID=415210 RepID=A0ABP4UG65_9MICO